MQYKMQIFTTLSGIPWEHNFDIASDSMAREWAMRSIQSAGPHSCMSVILWRMGDDEAKIGEFKMTNSVQRID